MKTLLGKLMSTLPTNGYTTYAGAIATIVIAVAGMVLYFVNPDSQFALEPGYAVTIITTALSVLGLGNKGEKADVKLDEIKRTVAEQQRYGGRE